jgi:hypothetical protein
LVKEGHRKVAQVEQPRFDVTALFEVLKNPLRWFFRKARHRAPDSKIALKFLRYRTMALGMLTILTYGD